MQHDATVAVGYTNQPSKQARKHHFYTCLDVVVFSAVAAVVVVITVTCRSLLWVSGLTVVDGY